MSDPASGLRAELQAALEGNYIIERELGRGGMGAVFLARDTALDRAVAIKVLPPDLAVRAELRERFLRETRTAASFSHPNIVPVHAVEARGDLLCFVMGFVEGESLAERLRRAGPLSARDASRMLQEVAWALSYAHGRGVVHRDIKPDNILIERATGRAMVTDFGIARSGTSSTLTSVGEVIGTPQFMSPEQAAGESLDGRSDLYSLGVAGFCAVTGHVPFDATSAPAILAMHLTKPAPPVLAERPDLPPALAGAIDRCLAKSPDDRFQTGEALADALDAVRSERPEVAPAIRLFQQKSATLVRNAFIFACFVPLALSRSRAPLDRVMACVALGSIVGAFLLLALLSLRELARQGFRYEELRAGLLAIGAERREAARLTESAPDWPRRRRRRRLLLLVTGLLAIGLFTVARTQRTPIPGQPGWHTVTPLGVVLFALSFIVGMMTIVFAAASGVQAGRMDGWISRLWTGPLGAGLFSIMGRGLRGVMRPVTPTAPSAPVGADARTMYTRMAPALRRNLRRVEPAIRRLDQAEREARDRIARLQRAEQDAATSSTAPGANHAARDQLIAELREARLAGEAHLATVLEAGEALRLALVRAESGLGGTDGVTGVIARIEGLPRP